MYLMPLSVILICSGLKISEPSPNSWIVLKFDHGSYSWYTFILPFGTYNFALSTVPKVFNEYDNLVKSLTPIFKAFRFLTARELSASVCIPSGTYKLSIPHPIKQPSHNALTPSGMLIVLRLEQFPNV